MCLFYTQDIYGSSPFIPTGKQYGFVLELEYKLGLDPSAERHGGSTPPEPTRYALVAQLVEQPPCKRQVCRFDACQVLSFQYEVEEYRKELVWKCGC